MKQLFDELSFSVSKLTTEKYSTSFSLGIMALKLQFDLQFIPFTAT